MVIAMDPRADTGSWEYVLKEDAETPEEKRTVWTLRPLTTMEWCRVSDRIVAGSSGPYSMALEVLQGGGLVSVRLFFDSEGAEVQLVRDQGTGLIPDDFLDRMTSAHLLELGNQAYERTTLSRSDVEKPEPSHED